MRKANNNRDRNTRVCSLAAFQTTRHPAACNEVLPNHLGVMDPLARATRGQSFSLNLSFFAAAVVLKLAAGAFRANNQEYIGNWISVVGFYWQLTPPFLRWLKF